MERKLNFEKFDVVNLNTEQMRSLQGGEAGTTAVVNATKKLVTDSSLGCFLATTEYFIDLIKEHQQSGNVNGEAVPSNEAISESIYTDPNTHESSCRIPDVVVIGCSKK